MQEAHKKAREFIKLTPFSYHDVIKDNPSHFKEFTVIKSGKFPESAFTVRCPFFMKEISVPDRGLHGTYVKIPRGAIIVGENMYPNRKAVEQDGYFIINEGNPLERVADTLVARLYQKLMNE